jgi:hypothetical protein
MSKGEDAFENLFMLFLLLRKTSYGSTDTIVWQVPAVCRWEMEPATSTKLYGNRHINEALTHAAVRAGDLTWAGGLHTDSREFRETTFSSMQKRRVIDSTETNWVCSAKQTSELRQGVVIFAVAEIAGFNFNNIVARYAKFFCVSRRAVP